MAFADTQTRASILQTISAPFAYFGNLLIQMGQASSLAKKVDHLNMMTDAELAALGTTRSAQIEKMFRAHTLI